MYLEEVVEAFEEMIELTYGNVDIMGWTFSALYILESNEHSYGVVFDKWLDDNYEAEWDADLEEHLYSPK